MTGNGWHEADPAAVTQAVHYALRFGLTGKAHGKRLAADDAAMAHAVVVHLQRASYRILQGWSRPPYSTSDFGWSPGGMPDGWADEKTPP